MKNIIFLLLILSSCTSLVLSAQNDELVLLKIKEQLGNPEFLSSWVDGFNFCNNRSVDNAFVDCTSTGRVNVLSLGGFLYMYPLPNVHFPEAICDLTELEYLSISKVFGIYGPIPSCINKPINLRSIHIWRTTIGGPIPELHNLSNLTEIDLSQNCFSGSIPPSLSKLPNLKFLDLEWNYLTGSIPPVLVRGPDAVLVLKDNRLTGEIPRCYGWANFSRINFSKNQLRGDVSFLFGKHKTVTHIDLSLNQFEFDLCNLDQIPENLTRLDLSFNRIYGKIPASLANKMLVLNLIFNPICGVPPFDSSVHDKNDCLCGSPLLPSNNLAPARPPVLAPPFGSTP